jgi:hypothetical protein
MPRRRFLRRSRDLASSGRSRAPRHDEMAYFSSAFDARSQMVTVADGGCGRFDRCAVATSEQPHRVAARSHSKCFSQLSGRFAKSDLRIEFSRNHSDAACVNGATPTAARKVRLPRRLLHLWAPEPRGSVTLAAALYRAVHATQPALAGNCLPALVVELRETAFVAREGLQRLVWPGQRRGTSRRLVCAGEALDHGYHDDRECQDSNSSGE